MNRLVLASASPRRQQLIALLGIPYSIQPSPINEEQLVLSGLPSRQAMDSAKAKAEAVARPWDTILAVDRAGTEAGDWVLAADTIVLIDGSILGKPKDKDDARRMLGLLSGREHTVITGLCLTKGDADRTVSAYEETMVWFMPLSDDQIKAYIDSGEPMDKAGAYGIQGLGATMIPRVEGCYFNVMGLPLFRTARMLEEAGIGLGSGFWKGDLE
ncbi:MAG: Maf family protein [Clostridiales bacterium]|nr:Maf family protein [Clostridiales bacterium]